MNIRYHVVLGNRRTTVSLDETLSAYLALFLGAEPETNAAHKAIRLNLQGMLNTCDDPGLIRVSQWLNRKVIELIVDKTLSKKYDDWLDSSLEH